MDMYVWIRSKDPEAQTAVQQKRGRDLRATHEKSCRGSDDANRTCKYCGALLGTVMKRHRHKKTCREGEK